MTATIERPAVTLLCIAAALCGCGAESAAGPAGHGPARISSVVVAVPRGVLAYGKSVQLTATARDTQGQRIDGVSGFTFSSGDPDALAVSESGLATAVFQLVPPSPTTVTATLSRDGGTVAGAAEITTGPPDVLDHAALMLSEYEVPSPVPTLGQGIAYFVFGDAGVDFTAAWSRLSGPAIRATIRGPARATDVADVLLDLPVGIQVSSAGSVTGSLTAADLDERGLSLPELLSLMNRGDAYVEVSTFAFTDGEIRGQVVEVSR